MTSARTWGRRTGRIDRQWQLTHGAEEMRLVAGGQSTTFTGKDLSLLSAVADGSATHWWCRGPDLNSYAPSRGSPTI